MARRWFLVYYEGEWHHVPVKQALRKYKFLDDDGTIFYTERSKTWLMRHATLRVLHDFKWWEYPPGYWKFGGEWP